MRVTIEHREERTGAFEDKRNYYVDCTVQFSEEEKAIINARGLHAHFITVSPPRRVPSLAEYMSAGLAMAFAPLVAFIGLVIGFTSIFRHGQGGELGAILFLVAPVMWSAGYIQDRRINYYLQNRDRKVPIRALKVSKFSVFSPDPAYSEIVEYEIREQLTALKDRIMRSAEIKPRETFEL